MSDCCCRCIPTPKGILDSDERDVFEDIFPDSEVYATLMREIMWSYYGFRGIGNCNLDYWINAMQLRYHQVKYKYMVKFKLFDEWMTAVTDPDTPIDLSDSSGESKTTTTHGHVITTSLGQKKNTLVIASKTDTTEREDTPDNPAGNTKYLASRDTVISGGHTDTSTDDPATDSDTHSGTDTVNFNSKTYSGLSSETVRRFMNEVPDICREFADEFQKQFYFGL